MIYQFRHVSAALLLHLLVFATLLSGVQCTRQIPTPHVIEAVLYDPSRDQLKKQKATEAERERQRLAEEKRRKEEARAESERKKKEETERQKAEAEKKKQADEAAARKKAEAEAQQKAAEAEKKKTQQEKREREIVEQRKAQLARELAQEDLRRKLADEARSRQQASISAQVNEWAARVERHIQKNWNRPSGTAEDFVCYVRVVLLPDGSVTSARMTKSCGNPTLDKSVVDAVYRSSPIPRPSDPAAFVRDLNIEFKPK